MIAQRIYDVAEELGIEIAPSKQKIDVLDWNGNLMQNSLCIVISMPAAFMPDYDLILPITSQEEVRVLKVFELKN
jgi:hypothetical protein